MNPGPTVTIPKPMQSSHWKTRQVQRVEGILTFLRSQRCRSPWIHTRCQNCKQGILRRSSPAAAWCGAAQATCVVGAGRLTSAPWQRPRPLITSCSELLGKHRIPQVQERAAPELEGFDVCLVNKGAIRRTWLSVTFFSQSWKCNGRGSGLKIQIR